MKPDTMEDKTPALTKLTRIMERLRSPDGCPWDREQTIESLTPFIIEEAYEVVSAIESGSVEDIKEELGDLFFQIVFVCELAREKGEFDINDVMEGASTKMVRRHPHVFGDVQADTSDDVLRHWAAIKEAEKAGVSEPYLSDVPQAFPSLLRAHKVTKKAAKVGFDWPDVDGVLDKVAEEIEELRQALRDKDPEATEHEMGDLLFALANVSRFVEVNPEEALRKTIGRFMRRFHYIECALIDEGVGLNDASLDEMERLWNDAKEQEKG